MPSLSRQLLHRRTVVDARNDRGHRDLVGRDASLVSEPRGAPRVRGTRAQRIRLHLRRGGAHRQGLDRRGIGVVEHPRVGGDLGDVSSNIGEHRGVTERPQDPARPNRIADVHHDPIAAGNLEVVGPRVHSADRDRRDHEIRAGERLTLVERAAYRELAALARDQLLPERLHHLDALLVDVHQHHLRVPKRLGLDQAP